MNLPAKFKKILEQDQRIDGIVKYTVSQYGQILGENKLYFFEEYTDHGIKHIESVLGSSERIITDDTFENILQKSPVSIGIYILSVILHDMGMHLTAEGLFNLISGRNDNVRNEELDKKTWKELWDEFLDEARRYGDQDKIDVIGNVNWNFKSPEIENKDKLTGEDKKLIGEFIRKHHPRIAYEVSIAGFPTANNYIPFASDLEIDLREISGLLAKSHGIEIRSLFDYLNKKFQDTWVKPYNIDLIFLMVVIRISDYFQIDSTRTPDITVKLKTFNSPISQFEHYKHLDVKYVQPYAKDPETIIFHCAPRDSKVFIKLQELFSDIQIELDKSWAVLGEIYGKDLKENQPAIRYRRVKSNIDNTEEYSKIIDYIPEKIKFNVSSELPKLLIGPLYGNDPTYGVRELLQNAVDSCREREFQEGDGYTGEVTISLLKENEQLYFQIEDNGIGMSLNVIKNYFLEVGSSLRKSSLWKKEFTDKDGKSKVQRSGKFGIGVLAAFLIGEKIILHTKTSYDDGYLFETNLNSDQIEIKKKSKDHVGTIIKIPITEVLINNLEHSTWKFDKWYILSSPIVKYNDQTSKFKDLGYSMVAPGYKDSLPIDWHHLKNTTFNKVVWTYNTDFLKEHKRRIICNGIVIPEASYYYKNTFELPYISIFDFNGDLSLNLNRNKIDGKIPFEDELVNEIFNDLIAKLFLHPVSPLFEDGKISIKEINYFEHPSTSKIRIIYSEEGFILRTNYFKTKNGDRNLLRFSLKNESDFPNMLFKDCNFFIDINEIQDVSMTGFQWNINLRDLTSGGNLFLDKKMFNRVFDMKFNRYPISVRRSRKTIFDDQDIIGISYNYTSDTSYFQQLLGFSKNCNYILETKVKEITNTDLNQFENIFSDKLETLLEGQSTIPYDIEERKKRFPQAFEVLKTYMEKYK